MRASETAAVGAIVGGAALFAVGPIVGLTGDRALLFGGAIAGGSAAAVAGALKGSRPAAPPPPAPTDTPAIAGSTQEPLSSLTDLERMEAEQC